MNAELQRLLDDALGDGVPERCLDLGCGDASVGVWLAERGSAVIGVDLNLPLPHLSHVKLSDVGPGRVTLINADMLDPGLEFDESFDRILALGLLHCLGDGERVRAALARIAGWLAPGGSALIVWLLDVAPVTGAHAQAYFPGEVEVAEQLERLGLRRSSWWTTAVEHEHGGPLHRHRVVYSSWRWG